MPMLPSRDSGKDFNRFSSIGLGFLKLMSQRIQRGETEMVHFGYTDLIRRSVYKSVLLCVHPHKFGLPVLAGTSDLKNPDLYY